MNDELPVGGKPCPAHTTDSGIAPRWHAADLGGLRLTSKSSCAAVLLGLVLVIPGCGTKEPGSESATRPAPAPAETTAADTATQGAIAEAHTAAKAGAFDDAAAQLLRLQASGQAIAPKDAAAYRAAMSEAYSRALEAAEKGDPKAKAALEMLKAARNR